MISALATKAATSGVPRLPSYEEWREAEAETANRERIVRELGAVPSNIMASPLVTGEWRKAFLGF